MTGADETTEAAQSGPPGMVRLTAGLGINWAAEQAAFERWYLATQCMQNYRRVSKHVETGLYVDKLVRIAWRAWRHGVERAAAGKVAVDA
jgi:hypothetical protein